MNGLQYFHPYSSCEGHVSKTGAGSSDHARIFFSLEDPDFIARLKPLWMKHEYCFQAIARQFFPEDQTRLVLKLGSIAAGGDGLCFHLESIIKRETEEIPEAVVQWFETTTAALSRFEEVFVQEIERLSRSAT